MSTITYKNQPAIHKSRGRIPLEGTSHIYTVSKLLWPESVEKNLMGKIAGFCLHLCCGKSKLGDIRGDLYEKNVDIILDMQDLPFGSRSFDTILIDMPYNSKFKIMHKTLEEIARVCKSRLIFQHWFLPCDKYGRYKKDHELLVTEILIWQPKSYFGRANIISIFDRIGEKD